MSQILSILNNIDTRSVDKKHLADKIELLAADGMSQHELYVLAAETAATMSTNHPDYVEVAGDIRVNLLHKETTPNILHTFQAASDVISRSVMSVIEEHHYDIQAKLDFDRDYDFDFFGILTLLRSYLLKNSNGKIVERPQHMYMRVAIGIHHDDLDSVFRTYDMLSKGYMTHATPTLYNAGTKKPQMSSCFLLTADEDSIRGIYKTLSDVALISQSAGGIGLAMHDIRPSGSYIKGTGGTSNGIVPMLRVFNDTARYVDQGGGKRKGGFAIYIEPWHADIYAFLDLRKNHGKEEMRARDLFYALWLSDLFMERVEADAQWSLFGNPESYALSDSYGDEHRKIYEQFEAEGKALKTISARDLWKYICDSQTETGTPYILHKDASNNKSNQKNLGTIRSSNLCAEIIQFTSKDEIAVCNLASICLPMFVVNGRFDFEKLIDVVKQTVRNLDRIIDRNFYPVHEARNSNIRHRPMGIGIQGLADVFNMLKLPFTSAEAKQLNADIAEVMYFAALSASCELAKEWGPYSSYAGSPASQGILQHDMWDRTNFTKGKQIPEYKWRELRADIAKFGLRNSLLMAQMPTASTSQIRKNTEAAEPRTSNIFARRTLSGDFVVINKHLIADLEALGLWNEAARQQLIFNNGSIQNMDVPQNLKDIYKTVWEISQKELIDMYADRAQYICQTQSMNLYLATPSFGKLSSMHFYAWKKGLKTGIYYLRTQAAANAIQFTVDQTKIKSNDVYEHSLPTACSIDNPDCEACGA